MRASALGALLAQLIDYAGMFPPAALSRTAAIANYRSYRAGDHNWMLGRFVVAAAEVEQVPEEFDGSLAVLSDMDLQRASVIETKRITRINKPVYCEVSLGELDEVQRAGGFAKIRAGGVKPEAIPSVEELGAFIEACADRRLPFKATAGLHHPLRAQHPLTYESDAPRAVMHGFLNVFLAAAFAWYGLRPIAPVLAETDAGAFRFDDRARWREWSLDAGQVRAARTRFAHSFGSCSFEEPVQGLEALGLL
jgi:hypothetical protein